MLGGPCSTGHVAYDFFMGHQLNPRIGSFDLKYFCELRPGLIGWAVINVAMMMKQYEVHGSISNSMVLVNLMQGLYVLDALWFEVSLARLYHTPPAELTHSHPRNGAALHCHKHGHHNGRLRTHAIVRRPSVGAVHIHDAGTVLGVHPCAPVASGAGRYPRNARRWLLRVPLGQLAKGRVPQGPFSRGSEACVYVGTICVHPSSPAFVAFLTVVRLSLCWTAHQT